MKFYILIVLSFSLVWNVFSQNATITGTVRDRATQEPLVGVSVVLEESTPLTGTVSDIEGKFSLTTSPGSYNVTASFVGYTSLTKFNVLFTSGNINSLSFELEEMQTTLTEIVVDGKKTAEAPTIESPLSVQRL